MSKAEWNGQSAAETEPLGMDKPEADLALSGSKLIDWGRPTWRIVLALALPVLAQQFLVLFVGLSDRVLAGRLQPLPKQQQTEALGHELMAFGLAVGGGTTGNWTSALASEAPGKRPGSFGHAISLTRPRRRWPFISPGSSPVTRCL